MEFSVRHDLGSLYTPPKELGLVEKAVETAVGRVEYLDPTKKGYGDGQLIQQKFKIPVAYLGPKGANEHAVDEWVDIASLKQLRDIYSNIIKRYCQ